MLKVPRVIVGLRVHLDHRVAVDLRVPRESPILNPENRVRMVYLAPRELRVNLVLQVLMGYLARR